MTKRASCSTFIVARCVGNESGNKIVLECILADRVVIVVQGQVGAFETAHFRPFAKCLCFVRHSEAMAHRAKVPELRGEITTTESIWADCAATKFAAVPFCGGRTRGFRALRHIVTTSDFPIAHARAIFNPVTALLFGLRRYVLPDKSLLHVVGIHWITRERHITAHVKIFEPENETPLSMDRQLQRGFVATPATKYTGDRAQLAIHRNRGERLHRSQGVVLIRSWRIVSAFHLPPTTVISDDFAKETWCWSRIRCGEW